MQKLTFIQRYFQYRWNSRSSFGVHPPFLFDLVTMVFENTAINENYLQLEVLKQKLMREKGIISVTDLGAGTTSGLGNARKIGFIARTSSKPAKYGRLLFRLAEYFKPTTILELGTSLGFSSAYLALGNPLSKVITIEGCPNIARLAQTNFDNLNIQNIQLVIGNFNEKLPAILYELPRIDFIFIDGNHKEEPTINYFEQCLFKAGNETVFIIDDIHWSEGMENAWNQIRNQPLVTLSVDIFSMGIIFIKKELTKQHFIIRF